MVDNQYGNPDDWNDTFPTEPNMVKRKVMCMLLHATRANPPHLVDIAVLNEQYVKIWYTIEPYTQELNGEAVQGWDVKFHLFRTFPWTARAETGIRNIIVDAGINMQNYIPAKADEWDWRIRKTNLAFAEEKLIRQHKGKFW